MFEIFFFRKDNKDNFKHINLVFHCKYEHLIESMLELKNTLIKEDEDSVAYYSSLN